MRHQSFIRLLMISLVGSVYTTVSLAGISCDMDILKNRIIQDILENEPDKPAGKAEISDSTIVRTLMREMKEDGSWPDIDYTNKRRANWPVVKHLRQVRQMAAAWHGPHELKGDDAVKGKIMAGLDYWLKHDLQCPNWYPNQITVPRELARILLLMGDEVSGERFDKSIDIIKRAEIRATGQNRVWLSHVCLMRGCLQNDENLVAEAIEAIAGTLQINEIIGLQADMSFWQHGRIFYNGGYGLSFANDGARWAYITRGTKFAFSAETIDTISRYILDGQQWMIRGVSFEPTARGRSIAIPDRQGQAETLVTSCRQMAQLGTARQAEFEQMARRLTQADAAYDGPTGNRHFWRSDYMAHQRKGYYTGAKMYSTRLWNTDGLINGEGVLSHYIADGSNFLMRTGREYDGIYGVLDWRRPPGVTVELKDFEGKPNREGNRDFVGGVSDGQYGAAVFDFARDGLTARKAWFFFDNEYVCLGAGIQCDSENQVITSINQCWLEGQVRAGRGETLDTLEESLHPSVNYDWIWHNEVGYLLLEKQALTVRNNTQTGSWNDINTNESPEPVSGDVFSIWLDHSVKPQNAQYSYLVCPDATVETMMSYATDSPVDIMANTPELQVVHHKNLGITVAICYQPATINCGDVTIQPSAPCLLLARKQADHLQLAVAEPTAKLNQLTLRINQKIAGESVTWDKTSGISTVTIALPGDLFAGQSVCQEWMCLKKED